MKIGHKIFDFSPHQIYLMGILNATPDSFSDGGNYLDPTKALDHALQMQQEGAELIDIGAESTRPGAHGVPIEEELNRLIPILKKLIPKISIPISIDTRKSIVAKKAIDEGASLINDVSGFEFDSKMIPLLAQTQTPAILMHSRGTPETMNSQNNYSSIVEDIYFFFNKKLAELETQGVSKDQLILDPGIGFAKLGDQNIEILSQLYILKKLNRPLMIGLSRKSFLEKYFGPTNHPSERQVGSEIAHTVTISNGANILRTHDVKTTKQTIEFISKFL